MHTYEHIQHLNIAVLYIKFWFHCCLPEKPINLSKTSPKCWGCPGSNGTSLWVESDLSVAERLLYGAEMEMCYILVYGEEALSWYSRLR